MATVTVYFLNTTASAPNWFGRVQDNGTAPGGALSAFGWTVGKTAVTTSFWRGYIGATARSSAAASSSSIDTAVRPTQGTGSGATTAGDSFRSDAPLNGTFAAGNWNFTFGMRTGAATTVGRIRLNVWASANADGTGTVRKLNSSTLVGTIVTMSTTTTTYNSTVTWAAPQVILSNEYLFTQIEWQETTAGTSNSCTAQFYQASFVTPDYVYVPATGTLAITETNDTIAAAGAVPIAGRLGTLYAGRASTATYFDSSRNLQTAANDVQRFGYDQFSGVYLGTIIEAAGTNLIFNPRALAATDGVIGSGGAFPAGWDVWGAGADIIYTVSNQRVVNNVPLIDIRFTGPMSTAGYMVFGFDSTLPVGPNTPGTLSFNIAISAGSTTNLAVISNIRFSTGAAANLDITNQLRTTLIRATNTATTPAGTTWVGACLTLTAGIGVPFDITLTLGLPQFETVGAATTYILPPVGTGAVSTRAADVITLTEANDSIVAAGVVITNAYSDAAAAGISAASATGLATTAYPLGRIAHTTQVFGSSGGGTTTAIDTRGANFLFLHISHFHAAGTIAVSDSQGNTWLLDAAQDDTSPPNAVTNRFYSVNSNSPNVSSNHTITVSGTNAYFTVQFSAWRSGTSWGYGALSTAGGTLPHGAGTIFAVLSGDLVLTGAASYGGSPIAVSSGTIFGNVLTAATNYNTAIAYDIAPSSASQNPIWSGSGITAVITTLYHGTWIDANASVGQASALGSATAVGGSTTVNDTGVGTASAVGTAVGVSPASPVVEVPDCILNWNLIAGTGTDLTSNSNDGVFSGGITPTSFGPIGNSAIFDGTGGAVVNDQVVNLSEVSISIWVKTTSSTGTLRHICGFGAIGSGTHDKDITLTSTSRVQWLVYPGYTGSGSSITGTTPVNDGEWHHIVCTISSSAQNIYVDGVLEATAAGGASYTGYTANSPNLGGYDVIASNWLPAVYDDFRVYSRAITALEVASLYSEASEDAHLVTYWLPGATRSDYNGQAGVKFKPATDLNFNRLGLCKGPGYTGNHTVNLYLWTGESGALGSPIVTAVVDVTGGLAGQFYYTEVPEFTLTEGVEYVLFTVVTIDAVQFWYTDTPVTLAGVEPGFTVSAYSIGTTMNSYRADYMYHGVDLALVEEAGGVADTGTGVATAIAVANATGRSDILRTGSATTTSVANATGRSDAIANVNTASATSIANATSRIDITRTGTASATSIANATSRIDITRNGIATSTSIANATGNSDSPRTVTATATSTVTSFSRVDIARAGSAAATSTATAQGTGGTGLYTIRYVDPDTFGAAVVGRGVVTLGQTRYVDPDTFRTPSIGRGPVTLTSTRYADPDTFGTASITTGVGSLAAVRYIDPDTFGTAVISRGTVTLTAARYLDPDTFGTTARIGLKLLTTRYIDADIFGTTTRIGFRLLQARYLDPDTFGTTSRIGRSVTTTRYVDADTFRNPSVGRGAVTLTSTRYISPDDFGTHVIQQQGGPRYLGANLYVDADTFRIPSIGRGPVGLTTTRYIDPDTYGTPTVIRGVRNLTAVRYVDPDVFRNHNLNQGAGVQTLVPTRFVNNNNFLAHQLRTQYTARPTRYVDPDTYYPYLVAAFNRLVPSRLVDPDQFYQVQLKRFIDPDVFVNQSTFHATEVILGQILLPSLWTNITTYGTPAITIRFAQHADPTLYEDPDYFYHTIVRIPPTAGISAIPGRYIVTNDPLREIVSTSSTAHRVIQSNRGVRTVTSL